MYFNAQEKYVLKAIARILNFKKGSMAFNPIKKEQLHSSLDKRVLNVTLNSMAARGILLNSGGIVTLSEFGAKACERMFRGDNGTDRI